MFCRSVGLDESIHFAEGLILPRSKCEIMGWGQELVNGTIDFADRLKEMQLDSTEFSIINAIVLTYPGMVSFTLQSDL